MPNEVLLRDVVEQDLLIFFEQQLDEEANYMAAFTAKNPSDQHAFMAHWHRILADPTVIIQTIILNGHVAGSVSSYEDEGKPEVTYWLGKEYWGKGIASWALQEFLAHHNPIRPIYARVAKDNPGSRRVLEKCGFTIIGESTGFAHARDQEIEELLLELNPVSSSSAEAVVRRFWELMSSNDFVRVGDVLADGFVAEWPQSNERIRGRDNYARVNSEYPAQGRWEFTINQLVANDIQVVTDVSITDGIQRARAISFFTVKYGKITRMLEYWPDDYPAPANRAHLVEALT